MLATVKILLLLFARKLEEVTVHQPFTRWVKVRFFGDRELSFRVWFTPSFWMELTGQQWLSLLGLGSLTLITFPLGMWLNSFTANLYFPLYHLVNAVSSIVLIPYAIVVYQRAVGELPWNRLTVTGLALVEIALLVMVVGWTMFYYGSKGAS